MKLNNAMLKKMILKEMNESFLDKFKKPKPDWEERGWNSEEEYNAAIQRDKEKSAKLTRDFDMESVKKDFPNKLLSISVQQSDRNYHVSYSYKNEKGYETKDSVRLRELDPEGLKGFLFSKKLYPSISTKYSFDTEFYSPKDFKDELTRGATYEAMKNSWRERYKDRSFLDDIEKDSEFVKSLKESKEKNYMKMLVESLKNK